MSPTTAGKTPLDALRSFERTTAQGLGSLWGMTLEHLSEKQAKAAAAQLCQGGLRMRVQAFGLRNVGS